MPTDSLFEEAWDFAKKGDEDIEKFFRRRNTMEEKMRILDMLFEADRQRNLARQQQLSINESQPEINVEEGSGERPVVGDQVAEEPRPDTGEGKKGNEENGGERKEPKVKDTPKPAEQPPKEATPKVEERVADIPKPPVGKVKKPKAEAITSKPPKSAEIPKPKTKAKKAKKDEIVSEPPKTEPKEILDIHGMNAQEAGYHFAHPDDKIDIGLEGSPTRGSRTTFRPMTQVELDEEDQWILDEDESMPAEFSFPESRPGGRLKSKNEAQTRLTDNADQALANSPNNLVPILDVQGNPVKIEGKTGWYVTALAPEKIRAFHESNPDVKVPLGGLKLPKKALGQIYSPETTYGNYDTVESYGKRLARLKNRSMPIPLYFPMPDSVAIDRKTGEQIKSNDESINDIWTVVKDPFANPIDNPNAFQLNDMKPKTSIADIPIVKQEPIIEPQKPKDLDGFNLNSGDDLSLLPASAFTKSSQMEVDTSLLPKGWAD